MKSPLRMKWTEKRKEEAVRAAQGMSKAEFAEFLSECALSEEEFGKWVEALNAGRSLKMASLVSWWRL